MDAHRLCDVLQIFFVLLFLEGNYEFLLHESNKVPYYFPHHLKVIWNVFLLSCSIYLPTISYVRWNATPLVILKHLYMSILHYSYILVTMRIIDNITRNAVKTWTATVSYYVIQHIRVEI